MTDFSTFDRRTDLAKQGVFSVDQPAHIALRARQRAQADKLDAAYASCGLDRKDEYRRIAAELEAGKVDGIWARSTKEYAVKCHALDGIMLDAQEA